MKLTRGVLGLLCVYFSVLGCKALNPAFDLSDEGTRDDETSTTDRASSGQGELTTDGQTSTEPTMTGDPSTTTSPSSSSEGMTTDSPPIECDQDLEPCAPLSPNACSEGYACRPIRLEGDPYYSMTACVPIVGSSDVGQGCERLCPDLNGIDSCAPRTVCDPFLDGFAEPTCIELCAQNVPCTQEDRVCVPHFVGPYALGLCRIPCDPLEPRGSCPPYAQCVYTNQDSVAACIPTGDFGLPGPGERCSHNGRCAQHSICVSGDFVPGCQHDRCCARVCELGGEDCDSDKFACEPTIPLDGPSNEIGACVP